MEPAPGSHAIIYEHGGAIVRDNLLYNWRGSNAAWPSGIWDKHNNGLANVTGNVETTGPIRETLTTAKLDAMAERGPGVWGEQYDGKQISESLRESYR